jgi:hypothetical protein
MRRRLREKTKHGGSRPRQNACLTARQVRKNPAPALEACGRRTFPMQEIVKAGGEGSGAHFGLHRVAHRHFLERKQKIGARLNRDRVIRDPSEFTACETLRKHRRVETFVPPPMRQPLIVALPLEIGRVGKAKREYAEKLTPGLDDTGTNDTPQCLRRSGHLRPALPASHDSRPKRDLPLARCDLDPFGRHLSPRCRKRLRRRP